MLKILIVEGNVKELRDKAKSMGILTQSDLYQKVLNSLADDLDCTIVYPGDEDAPLPTQSELADYDGIAWTGSALNIYNRGPAVDCQIDFMQRTMEEETHIFGSCWGMQVATVAAGGEVAANPKGREIGIARDIEITEEGLSHPLYKDKSPVFDAIAVHLDNVVQLPAGTRVLSANNMSQVQAMELKHGRSTFWGVQYHPEYDLDYIAALIRRYEKSLIDEGFCKDATEVQQWASDMVAALQENDQGVLKKHYCLDDDVLDPDTRRLELSNWLSYLRETKVKSDGKKIKQT